VKWVIYDLFRQIREISHDPKGAFGQKAFSLILFLPAMHLQTTAVNIPNRSSTKRDFSAESTSAYRLNAQKTGIKA
jgi:hypothetical protein